jgi:hypothetical protein
MLMPNCQVYDHCYGGGHLEKKPMLKEKKNKRE